MERNGGWLTVGACAGHKLDRPLNLLRHWNPMRTVNLERQRAKRQGILQAATECFAAKGFHRTSTAEICAKAEMSPGNLFHYFPSKQAIIDAIVEEEGSETTAYFAEAGQASDLFAELLAFMDVILALASDPAYLKLRLEITAEAARDRHVGMLVARNDADLQDALNALLRNAAARGQVDPKLDPATSARWVNALIDGVFCRTATDPDFKPTNQRDMLRLLLTRFLRPGVGTAS